MGYVVGYLYPSDGLEWLCCSKDGQCCSSDYRKPEYHPLAHKIEATAKALAEKLSLTSAWQVFYRPYLYATDNPKYAKGLQIWTGVMKKTFVGKPNLLTKAQPCDIVSPT